MLSINPQAAKTLKFKTAFEVKVFERKKDRNWKFPERWNSSVPLVMAICEELGADVVSFVHAQFDVLPASFCNRVFRLPYPPIGCFISGSAKARYKRYKLLQESLQSYNRGKNHEEIILQMINNEYKDIASLFHGKQTNFNLFMMKVLSGSVSLFTIAFLFYTSCLTSKQVEDVLKVTYGEKGRIKIQEEYVAAMEFVKANILKKFQKKGSL